MLNKLWQISDSFSADAFCNIGLTLQRPPIVWDYDSTPLNSITFASTGGDGVHFSFLNSIDPPNGESPVVMTVPMALGAFGRQNVIVGRNLSDFLSLGCASGYFILEQLVYEKDQTIAALTKGNPKSFGLLESDAQLLDILKHTFSLKPWSNVLEHLDILQDEFAHIIQYSHDYMLLHDESPKRKLVITSVGSSKIDLVRIIRRERSVTSSEALELIRSGEFTMAEGTELTLKPLDQELKTIGVTFIYQKI